MLRRQKHSFSQSTTPFACTLMSCRYLFSGNSGRPRPAQGLPGPSGPEPRKSPKRVPEESEKSPRGGTPGVPKECAPESQKSPKRVRKPGFRLFSDSFETPGCTLSGLQGSRSGGLFPDSSGTLFGLFRGSGLEGPGRPCAGRGRSQFWKIHRSSKNAVRRFFLYYDQVKICLIKSSDSPTIRRKKRLIKSSDSGLDLPIRCFLCYKY